MYHFLLASVHHSWANFVNSGVFFLNLYFIPFIIFPGIIIYWIIFISTPIFLPFRKVHGPHKLFQLLPYFSASLYVKTSWKKCLCLAVLPHNLSPAHSKTDLISSLPWNHACRCHQEAPSCQTPCSAFTLILLDFSTTDTTACSLPFQICSPVGFQENTPIFFQCDEPLHSSFHCCSLLLQTYKYWSVPAFKVISSPPHFSMLNHS